MKNRSILRNFSARQIVGIIVILLSLLLFLVLTFWSKGKIRNLPDQQAAERWDAEGEAAQVSCYFAESVVIDEMQLMSFTKQFEQQLLEVLSQEEKAVSGGRRIFVDAYSSMGSITVVSEKGKVENARAVGIGGDFFLFHPLQLVSGQYFSGSDLMKDSVIVDEEAAWQLFGSNDIAGKSVMIGEVPHYIAGVIKRPEGRFAQNAGLDKTVIYVSNETLASYGSSNGICNYEIIAPNPVKNFVYTAVKEKLGVAENDMIVVENSSRYSVESLIPVILDFGTRSMQHAAVKFPYWENIARGWEDVMAMVVLWQGILLTIPTVIMIIYLWFKWKNRTWTGKEVYVFFLDKIERFSVKMRNRKEIRLERNRSEISDGEEI